MKKNILFSLILLNNILFAQNYSIDKSKEFVYPKLEIKSPIDDLKMFHFLSDFKPKNYKIKSIFSNNILTEYDIDGNVISQTMNEFGLYNTRVIYEYKNGLLLKKTTTKKADKEKIEKENRENERRAVADMQKDGIATTALFDSQDTEVSYRAKLDKKDRITMISNNIYNLSSNEKKITSSKNTKIDYLGNKITRIYVGDDKNFYEMKYFYDGNLLTSQESIDGGTDIMRYQQHKEIYKYLYDNRKNLVAIYNVDEYYIKGRRNDKNSLSLKDSANYDIKNRMIWHGNKYNFSTYEYDKNNNVIKLSSFKKVQSGYKINVVQEYEYDKLNNLIKYSEFDYRYLENPKSSSKKFVYENGLLKEVQTSSEKYSAGSKTVFEYNSKNQLVKKTEYYPKRFKEKDALENEFYVADETIYIYGEKSLIINGKYGKISEYIFY